MRFFNDLALLTVRLLTHSRRMPAFVIIAIVQPVLWLALFGPLFGRVTELGGFGGGSYLDFLLPGVAIMSALFGSAYSGMALLMDHDRAILDRLLVTPAARGALIGAYIANSGVVVMVQVIIILLFGLLMGADLPSGLSPYLILLFAAALTGAGFGALSNALALALKRHDAIIAVMNFITLPLFFLSSMIMAVEVMPDWIRVVAAFNPVNWAVIIARGAFTGAEPMLMLLTLLKLAGFSAFCIYLAVRGFRRFMRTA